MQRKGIFPTFQLIFCRSLLGLWRRYLWHPQIMLDLFRILLASSALETDEIQRSAVWQGWSISCFIPFPDATEWLLSRPTFGFSPFVPWSGLILPQLRSPQKLWIGTTQLNIQHSCAVFARWGLGRRVSICSISSLVYRFLVFCICGIITRGKRKPSMCMDVWVWRERRGCW